MESNEIQRQREHKREGRRAREKEREREREKQKKERTKTIEYLLLEASPSTETIVMLEPQTASILRKAPSLRRQSLEMASRAEAWLQ